MIHFRRKFFEVSIAQVMLSEIRVPTQRIQRSTDTVQLCNDTLFKGGTDGLPPRGFPEIFFDSPIFEPRVLRRVRGCTWRLWPMTGSSLPRER